MTMSKKFFLSLGLLLMLLPVACTEKESDLGVNLQDPYTRYSGTRDTVSVEACTVFDDSLSTAGYTAAVFGNYNDAVFGKCQATIYSQIALASTSTGINLSDEVVIDSVKMTLVIDTACPIMPEDGQRTLRVIVNQLAEPLKADSGYFSFQQLPEGETCFFDDDVVFEGDSLVLKLRENIFTVLKQNCSSADFLERTKGFSLKMADTSMTMLAVNFSATNTRITLYYHTATSEGLTFVFPLNSNAARTMYYRHDYTGTAIAPIASHAQESVDGSAMLYLEPLGGTKLRLNMQPFLDAFRAKHPSAVIHYAELLLPVYDPTSENYPLRLLALKRKADGSSVYVTDADVLTNNYTYAGFDGYYHPDKHQYRMRVTQHLQELLREGKDYGTEIIIDARRSSAFRTVLNGSMAADPIRIEFIYSE